jgi:hypothetical protein
MQAEGFVAGNEMVGSRQKLALLAWLRDLLGGPPPPPRRHFSKRRSYYATRRAAGARGQRGSRGARRGSGPGQARD